VQNPENADNFNESSPPFTVRGNITLTNPYTGEESWDAGSTYPINWSYIGPIQYVTIQYCVNGSEGSPWVNLTDATEAINGTWNWTIVNTTQLSTKASIKVFDRDQPLTESISANFTTKGAVHVDTPNASGIVVNVGQNYNITWTRYGNVLLVNLSYSTHGEDPPWIPIVSGYNATKGYYLWPVEDNINNSVRVKVEDTNNVNVFDISDNNFTIVGSVTLIKPDTNEDPWVVGEVRQIQWEPTGNYSQVLIQGSSNGFANESETWNITTVAAGTGGVPQLYNYTIPYTVKLSEGTANTKVRVRDADPYRGQYTTDVSTEPFKVFGIIDVLSPNTGTEVWKAGDTPTVQWQTFGTMANVTVRLWNGLQWLTMTNATNASAGYFTGWTIPDNAVYQFAKVNVSDATEPLVNDSSNSSFTIIGTIGIVNPDTVNEPLYANETYDINWTRKGIYAGSTATLAYSTTGFAGPYNIICATMDISNPNGTHPWFVPGDTLSTNVYLNLTHNSDPLNVYNFSPKVRIAGKILPPFKPELNDVCTVNKTCNIKWAIQGNIQNVSLRCYVPGKTFDIASCAGTKGAEVSGYEWTIPNEVGIITTNATVRIIDDNDALVYNFTPQFSILPTFNVTDPPADANLTANVNYTIRWKTFGQVDKVNIYYDTNNFAGAGIQIADNVTDEGAYIWYVNDTLSDNVQVRVAYANDTRGYNDSAIFRILPGFTIISPNETSKWPVGTMHPIVWNCTSANEPYINLTYFNGSVQSTINGSVNNSGAPHALRYYNWSVPNTISSQFKVKVKSTNLSRELLAFNESYEWSKIVGFFNVVTPNATGIILTVNQTYNITWLKNGTVPLVTLWYSKNDFVDSQFIDTNVSNDLPMPALNWYNWTVPDFINETVKVRVMDKTDEDGFDDSDNYFKIIGAFNVSAPVDGDRLPIGYNTTLSWNTTGNITKVHVVAYSTMTDDPRFNFTSSNPYNISLNHTNIGNDETTLNWTVPDNATNHTRIRIIDANDSTVWAESSGNFSMIGSFNITQPVGGEIWSVNDTENITWVPTGISITQARIAYCINGTECLNYPTTNSTWWRNISEDWGTSNDGIVDNNGTFAWVVPDNITVNPSVYIRIEDPLDSSVNDTTDAGIKIRGNFTFLTPSGGERWVTNEVNHTIIWNTLGTIPKVNIYYSRDNFTTTSNITVLNASNGGSLLWAPIPDPVAVYSFVNTTYLPVNVTLRIVDANDPTVYTDSPEFQLDYYNITWFLRDFLSGLNIAIGLSVNCSSGWSETGLASPIENHKTPYGSWRATWSHESYGSGAKNYIADSDKSQTLYLESLIVHVWEARTDYVYEPCNGTGVDDKLTFKSYLTRDGAMAGSKDENGTFYTIAQNCTIEIYKPDGTLQAQFYTDNVSGAGFFNIEWGPPTNLSNITVYNAITQIETYTGGIFRTPFLMNIIPTVSLHNVAQTIAANIDVPLSVIQQNLSSLLTNQTVTIQNLMDNQTKIIENKTDQMIDSVNYTLSSFENRTYAAIASLETGANATLNASQNATLAAAALEATAMKFSWDGTVSPDPALTGEEITLSIQGPSGYLPLLNIYDYENTAIIRDQYLTESIGGLYSYTFEADSRFPVGKAYTYIVSEQVTSGLVTGSGYVESMSMTTVAGLASAAPQAERAAKKALDAIKAVEAVLVSGDNINIALTLKSLKDTIETLPEALARDVGSTKQMSTTLNSIADKLAAIGLEEGFDFTDLLEEALGESPTIKDVRNKTDAINAIVELLLAIFENKFGGVDAPVVSTSLLPGSVRFRIIAVNPSKVKTQRVQIRSYLPQEVTSKDIMDLGGLDLEYDESKGIYYAYRGEVELAPSEVRAFEVEVRDVWLIPERQLNDLNNRTEVIMAHLSVTEYAEKAQEIADSVYKRLKDVKASQEDDTVSSTRHIGIYRENLETLNEVKQDMARMEKLLSTAGKPLAPELLKKTKIKSDEPSRTMTWVVIFTLVIFLGLLASVLYFTWLRQARLTREELLASKRSAFPEGRESQDKETRE